MAANETDPLLASPGAPNISKMVERRFQRYTVEIPCLYSVDGGPDWNGTAVNLSRGGCAIHGTTPVQKGMYLRLRLFPAADHPPIEVGLAPVRWTTNEHFGVEFITLTPRDILRLKGYLAFLECE